jgi:hypothetical protein
MRYSTLIQGIIAGVVAGLAGTISMYLFGAGIFELLGWPANTSISIIGDSAAAFFSKLGIALAGGPPLGMWLFCLIGVLEGAIMGAAVVSLEPLRLASLKKRVGFSILFVEVMSLPLLVAGTFALNMGAADAALWFSISFVMHLVYGLVMGVVASFGVRDRAELSSNVSTSTE